MTRRSVRRRSDVIVSTYTELHDRSRANFLTPPGGPRLVFGEEELFLYLALDGRTPFAEIAAVFAKNFGQVLSPRQFESFLYQLYDLGLIETCKAPARDPSQQLPEEGPGYLDYVPLGPRYERIPWAIHVLDPSRLLGALAWLGRPVRGGIWLLPPLAWLAGLVIFRYENQLFTDLGILQQYVNIYLAVACAFFLDNLLSRLAQGAVATAYGAPIKRLGISAFLGVLPRFFIEDMPIRRLKRSEMLWCYAAPFLFRMWLLAVGTLIWITFRAGGSPLAWFGLLCSELGFWSAILSIWPVLPGDAYRFLCTLLNNWSLRSRSLSLILNLLRGVPPPKNLSPADRRGLLLFGALTILATGALAAAGFLYVGYNLVSNFAGAGMLLWTALCAGSLAWVAACFRSRGTLLKLSRVSDRSPSEPFESVEGTGL
jgi:hypothetical protein